MNDDDLYERLLKRAWRTHHWSVAFRIFSYAITAVFVLLAIKYVYQSIFDTPWYWFFVAFEVFLVWVNSTTIRRNERTIDTTIGTIARLEQSQRELAEITEAERD
jgi:hypothetical protein